MKSWALALAIVGLVTLGFCAGLLICLIANSTTNVRPTMDVAQELTTAREHLAAIPSDEALMQEAVTTRQRLTEMNQECNSTLDEIIANLEAGRVSNDDDRMDVAH